MELFLPKLCAGCGAAGEVLCEQCKTNLSKPPFRISTRVTCDIPLWTFAPYNGTHRNVVISMKEKLRLDLARYLGAVLYAGIDYLAARGELPDPAELTLVPAPTRPSSARKRGGDPVSRFCHASGIRTVDCLSYTRGVKDSVGLDAASRRLNLSGNITLSGVPTGPVLIVDDVITTGATIFASSGVLASAKVQVIGGVSITHA